MKPGLELVFLKKRKGFIRLAMQHGSPIIPVYAFGQNGTYGWLRPGPPLVSEETVAAVSRKIGGWGSY
jgi:2-acylglycerol O-acyltransferase 2